MNMLFTHFPLNRRLLFAFISFSSLSIFAQYQGFRPKEFEETLKFFYNHKNEFKKVSKGTRLDSKQIFSIVAPEICEFSSIGDFFESNSLKVLYVQNGSSYADFSIGYFQMKPSFIEKLEEEIKADRNLNFKFKKILIASKDLKSKRRERIRRLEDLNWQFKYLHLFVCVFEKKMKFLKLYNSDEIQELEFFSTAYNSGFYKQKKELEIEMNKTRFPRESAKKFNYSRVSLEFYKAL